MVNTWRLSLFCPGILALVIGCAADDDGLADETVDAGDTSSSASGDTGGDDGDAAGTDGGADDGADDTTDGDGSDGEADDTTDGDTTDGGGSETDGGDTTDAGGELPADPVDPGDDTWTVTTFDLPVDTGTLPLTLYIPDSDGPHATAVFTHGFQLGPADYASYGEHLASHGFVVIMPQMPGSLFSPTTHVQLRDYIVEILDWIVLAGLDASSPLQGKADPAAIGLTGHSMGGKISIFAATSDPRPLGVFGIDPVDAAGGPGQGPTPENPSVTPELMDSISIPLVLLGETTNASDGFMACAPAEDNFRQYFINASSPALEIEVLGANHMSFLDDTNCGIACSACPTGTDDPAQTASKTRGYLTAFFALTLRGDEAYRPYLVGAPMDTDVAAGLVTYAALNGF